jgi:hypothetical protein
MMDDPVILAELVGEWPASDARRGLRWQAWCAAAVAAVIASASLAVTFVPIGQEAGWFTRVVLFVLLAADAFWALVLLFCRRKPRGVVTGVAGCLGLCVIGCVLLLAGTLVGGYGDVAKRTDRQRSTHQPPVLDPQPLQAEPLDIRPREVNTLLIEKVPLRSDISLTILNLYGARLARGCPWSEDGRRLFFLQKDGNLLEVHVPEWEVRRQLTLPGTFSGLALCKAGLVLVRNSTSDLVLVDAQTLTTKCCVHMPGAHHIAASPAAPLVFAPTGRKLRIVNMEDFTLQQELDTGEEISHPEVTPDGKYFFCAGGFQSCMRRFAICGGGAVVDGRTRRGTNVRQVDVSADSKYAAIAFGGGASPPSGYPNISYATYVYHVDDLTRPAMALYPGAYPHTAVVDPATGRFYTQNSDCRLIVFSAGGELENAYRWYDCGDTQRLIVHPHGKKVLVITEGRLAWVELPDNLHFAFSQTPARSRSQMH